METDEKGKFNRAFETSSSGERSNMERTSSSRQNVNAVPLARLSSFDGWSAVDGDRSINGYNWLLR